MITKELKWPDTVSLALTCKHLAEGTQLGRNSFAKVEARQKAERRARRAAAVPVGPLQLTNEMRQAEDVKAGLKPPTKFTRLEILRQLGGFFPAQYRLCFGCIKYVPISRGGNWGGDNRYLTTTDDGQEAHESGPRCAWCVAREDLEQKATRAELDSLKQLVARI